MPRTPCLAVFLFLFLALPGPSPARAQTGGPLPAQALHLDVTGRRPADRFGTAVDAIGDLDGDGVRDWIAGAPHADGAGPSTGAARVVSGRTGKALLALRGSAAGSWYGYAVAGTGDVDADGVPDFAVGAPLADVAGVSSAGRARVYSGRTGAVLWTWTGAAAGDRLGQTLCAAGDLDADGYADVAVGAPYADGDAGGPNAGRVLAFSGRDGALLFDVSGAAWDFLGLALDGAGDVDGDGRDDLLVGAPFADAAAFNGGSAFVLSGVDGAVLRSLHGAGIGDQLGHWVAGTGDADGDGVPDVAVGAPGADLLLDAGEQRIDAGAAELRSGADGTLLWRLAGSADGEGLGRVARVGDVDGDGRADVAVGAPGAVQDAGRVHVVSGVAGDVLATHVGSASGDWLGVSAAGLGDVDGDGWPDLALGAPGHDDDPEPPGYVRVLSALALPSLTPSEPR